MYNLNMILKNVLRTRLWISHHIWIGLQYNIILKSNKQNNILNKYLKEAI